MGVPKFYRWLSERYPCLSQVIKEHQIPEFDNLYLDMNGIIHPCSHPNDDDPHFRITEAQIFKNIFNYIEVLFRIIKPKNNFFMAVDGCAPRAKMNQQRSRRFRTAKDAEDNIRKALMKGHTLPQSERFDSNCITPGTEFMAKLQEQLKYFVNQKISTDPLWQKCNVYLSGHNVPGEGEHKIMDFIRYSRSQPDYDPNTRHCLYGLDADLIILGMSTHDPHFALLREEVRYGKTEKRMVQPEEQTFHLLHLSLLREYLDFEFQGLKRNLHFPYSLERIIDDWVILGFLVGNDFVPHFPNLHINHDAFPYLFKIYKEFMVTADGYINDGGYLNIHRLKKFFECLAKFDRENFENIYADLKWLESKTSGNMLHKDNDLSSPSKQITGNSSFTASGMDSQNRSFTPSYLADVSGLEEFYGGESPQKSERKLRSLADDDDVDVEVEDEETFELEFKQHKRQYYMEKFDMDIVDDEQLKTICYEYLRALQWIAHYYFNGLQSWSWYYPYHYSPYVSDVASLEMREIEFDMATPFHPFEQLLAVLPSASRKLLPEAFQNLMIDNNSPIIDFYPQDFRTDLNGKQQDWEAVVLIPFINENRLMDAMELNYQRLTDEEKERNSFGECFMYRYDRSLDFVYPTPSPGQTADISTCKAKVEHIHREKYHMDPFQIKKGMLKGTMLDVYYHGFPTMKHLKVKAYLKKGAVKVFQQHSRNDNTILKILYQPEVNMELIANRLVGETAFVEWPYMVEATVTSICNDSIKYYLDESNELVSKLLKGDEYNQVMAEMKTISQYMMGRRGVELGQVQILVEAKLLLGQRYICEQGGSVRMEKEWRSTASNYAYQTVVQNLEVHSANVEVCDSIGKLFTPGSLVFMMSSIHYGCSGEVTETDKDSNRVRVTLKVPAEPNFEDIIYNYSNLSIHYIPDRNIAQRLGITTNLLGRLTGNIYVVPDSEDEKESAENIGLKLKYSGKNKEVLGFARRTESGWTYSPLTIGIIEEYMKRFPDVFEALGRIGNQDRYPLSTLLPDRSNDYLDEIKVFLRAQKCYNVQPVRCGSNVLDNPIVDKIKRAVEQAQNKKGEKKIVKVKVKPNLLFRPTEQFGKLTPDPATEFFLFDRVVNIQHGIAVPIGLRGTIIGFHDVLQDENDKESPTELRYEVLFDEHFLANREESLAERRGYFMSSNSLLNISYGKRKELGRNGAPQSAPTTLQNKISHPPVTMNASNSPYGGRTPGSNQNTPKSVYHSYPKSCYSAPSSKAANDSPDWLHGSYKNKGKFSTPEPLMRQQILQHPGGSEQKRYQSNSDNTDFFSMWSELQKNERAVEKNTGDKNQTNVSVNKQSNSAGSGQINPGSSTQSISDKAIDQDATAMLQKMLNIKDQMEVPGENPISDIDSKTDNQCTPANASITSKGQQPKRNTKLSTNSSGSTAIEPTSSQRSPSKPSIYRNTVPQAQYAGGRSPLLAYPRTPPAMQNMYANFNTPPSYGPPTSLLHSPANMNARLPTAPILNSPMCNTSIFQQLCNTPNAANMRYPYGNSQQPFFHGNSPMSQNVSPLKYPYNQSPQMGHALPSNQYPASMMPFSNQGIYQPPTSFYSPRQGFQTPQQFAHSNRSHGNSNTNSKQSYAKSQSSSMANSNEKQKKQINQFIPHQVMMRNSTRDPETEIKGILGIPDNGKDKEAKPRIPAANASDADVLKSLLGVNPISDDEKSRKSTIGDSSYEKTNVDNKVKYSSTEVAPNAPLLDASHVGHLDHQRINAILPTPTVGSQFSATCGDPITATNSAPPSRSSHILLAPSFFGPKKKSL